MMFLAFAIIALVIVVLACFLPIPDPPEDD